MESLIADLHKFQEAKTDLENRLKILEACGIEFGTESYKHRENKDGSTSSYMRILRPTDENGKRSHVYVGTCPIKQRLAKESIQRGVEFEQIKALLVDVDSTIRDLRHRVSAFEFGLSTSLDQCNEQISNYSAPTEDLLRLAV
jgi:hypothetical protein